MLSTPIHIIAKLGRPNQSVEAGSDIPTNGPGGPSTCACVCVCVCVCMSRALRRTLRCGAGQSALVWSRGMLVRTHLTVPVEIVLAVLELLDQKRPA